MPKYANTLFEKDEEEEQKKKKSTTNNLVLHRLTIWIMAISFFFLVFFFENRKWKLNFVSIEKPQTHNFIKSNFLIIYTISGNRE